MGGESKMEKEYAENMNDEKYFDDKFFKNEKLKWTRFGDGKIKWRD